MTQIDLLISAKWILPIAPQNSVLKDHALAVKGNQIVDLLPYNEAKEKYYADAYMDMKDHVLMPGMVNSHTHTPMNLFRGLADDLDLMDWLNNHIWPAESAIINPETTSLGAELAIAEMIRGGTTCFNDHYFFAVDTAKIANKMGIRARIGLLIMDIPTQWSKNEDEAIAACQKVLNEDHKFELTDWAIGLQSTYTSSLEGLVKAKRLSDDYGLPVHMHVHETVAELNIEKERSGTRPLEQIEKAGLLNDRFIAVHMVHLNDEDLERVAKSGCHIVLCPDSNLKLASGIPPINQMLKAGNNLCVGTDGAASNNDLDMFSETRLAATLAKVTSADPKVMPAADALYMATMGGAKALQMSDKIGSLEAGKQADFIAINLNHLFTQPTFDPMSQIIYAANRLQVSDVWIAGKRLLNNGELTQANCEEILERAKPLFEKAKPFSSHQVECATES